MSHFQESFGRTRYGNLWNLWKPEKLYLCHARKALIEPKLSYRFRGFWVSEFQETWKLVKTSKNPESILTFCWCSNSRQAHRRPFEETLGIITKVSRWIISQISNSEVGTTSLYDENGFYCHFPHSFLSDIECHFWHNHLHLPLTLIISGLTMLPTLRPVPSPSMESMMSEAALVSRRNRCP